MVVYPDNIVYAPVTVSDVKRIVEEHFWKGRPVGDLIFSPSERREIGVFLQMCIRDSPYPAQEGLWGKPTVINNVETYANIPPIILQGADWFRSIGAENSKGTKVFALAGDINNTGLVEVPMGISLGEVIYDLGGGIRGGKKLKAVQIGGPSGGCIPVGYLNVKIDYDSLKELGAIMGSGGLIVMDEDTCMVDLARFFLEFVQDESCGKCTPCRIGTKRMLEILQRITQGEGRAVSYTHLKSTKGKRETQSGISRAGLLAHPEGCS